MEATALRHRPHALRGPTPLLRLQGDDRLVALTRRGHQTAYEVLVARYETRLLAFCRHMLGSREDAEDVLQEVFAAAYAAMVADERTINVRPWLYRIARNRCLNHLRRQTAIGVDSMDVHFAEHGKTAADAVHDRERFRLLVGDVQGLPETQRTALLLREIEALSYDQIAEAMDTTVPSVKSLLVRARVQLAEAAEARELTCEEVRIELGEVAEGLCKKSPPVRRHVKTCERCATFDRQLKKTNRAIAAAVAPIGPLLALKQLLAGGSAAAGTAAAASSAALGTSAGAGAGGILTAGAGAMASKAVAGLAAAAVVTAGAVEVDRHRAPATSQAPVAAAAAPAVAVPADATPRVVVATPQPPAVDPRPAAAVEPPATAAATSSHPRTPAPPAAASSAVPVDAPAVMAPGIDGQPAGPVDTAATTSALTAEQTAPAEVLAPNAPLPVPEEDLAVPSLPAPAPSDDRAAEPAPAPLPDALPAPGAAPQPEAVPQPEAAPAASPADTAPAAPEPQP